MSPMTEPRSPIHIAGEPFTEWTPADRGRGRLLTVVVPDDMASALLGTLGQYVPGILEDGTAVEFYIASVRYLRAGAHEVQLIAEVRPAGGVL